MANKILYTDKETFQVSPLDEVNKATAANFNSIKDTVNFNADELDARPSKVQNSDNTFDVDTGAADAYDITLSPAITVYVKGQSFSFEAINANLTTTPTVDVNGVGAKIIINRDGSALAAGDIPANSLSIIQYDGTNFQLLTSPGVSGGGGGAAIFSATLTLNQSEIQALNTTPIELIPDPGGGKYVKIISGSAHYVRDTSNFVGGSVLQLRSGGVNYQSVAGFISNSSNALLALIENQTTISLASSITVTADADSTGGGAAATIQVDVQFVIIDTA